MDIEDWIKKKKRDGTFGTSWKIEQEKQDRRAGLGSDAPARYESDLTEGVRTEINKKKKKKREEDEV
jgi:hypothetical protein